MKRLGLAFVVCSIGCAPMSSEQPGVEDEHWTLDPQEVAPPPTLEVLLDMPTSAAAAETIQLVAQIPLASANTKIRVVVSQTGEGQGICPGALQGQCLGVTGPYDIFTIFTDATGMATLDYVMPDATVSIQAVLVTGGGAALSEVQTCTVDYPGGFIDEQKMVAPDGFPGDWYGYSVAGAGDINNDSYADVIVGAGWDDHIGLEPGGQNSGSAYVYFGSPDGVDMSTEDKIHAWDASDGDAFGKSVASAGDVDDDDYADVIVGAPDYWGFGAIYVYFGRSTGIDHTRGDAAIANDFTAGQQFGASVSAAGDVDGDGYPDVIVGAPGDEEGGPGAGAAYVVYGANSGLDWARQTKIIASDSAVVDGFGTSVSGAGDLNGDDYADVVVGATAGGVGAAYVYYGGPNGPNLNQEDKIEALDMAPLAYFGTSVSGAGDVNGDDYDDIVVGAYNHNGTAGSAYVYYGSAAGIRRNTEEQFSATDGLAGDAFGYSVASAGDLDGDGYSDILVGAYADYHGAWDWYVGSTYVYFGSAAGINMAREEKIITSDNATYDYFGYSVSGAGDIDGDGYGEIISGAYGYADEMGATYVYSYVPDTDPPVDECPGGPLANPIPNCAPVMFPSTGDWGQDCVDRINQFRWECQCLPPMTRWTDGEICTTDQSALDQVDGPHANFGMCGEWAQNSCDTHSPEAALDGCMQMMWDEGPAVGGILNHYEIMSAEWLSEVACGYVETPSGVWTNQNFR